MKFKKFHFHIYFEPKDLTNVQDIVEQLERVDHIDIGRIWDKPVGPHPIGSCQITVPSSKFYEMSDWFIQKRKGLSIFIHAVSGDDLKDHTDHVSWIGTSYRLNLGFFKS